LPTHTAFIAAVTLVAATLLMTSGCAQPGSARVQKLVGGQAAYRLLLNPDTAAGREAYRIDGMAGWTHDDADQRRKIHAFPIISGPVPIDDASAATLANVLTDDDTYLWDIAKACEFMPGVALRYDGDETQIDILLCFSCDELEVYRDGQKVGHEDFDPRRPDLVRLAKHLFPDDQAIQGLTE